ncbi:hypothetical protein HMPREF3113_13825 [Stenotrophomonas sp. HMSC10F06]|nr:hypothetical protein HMPREF3113_13825 [Stenotrophomonas sp. HMSC10F06]
MVTREVSMASKQYTDEFKSEAIKQVTERGFAVAEVGRSQEASATRDLNSVISLSITSAGVFQPSVCRGRVFMSIAT